MIIKQFLVVSDLCFFETLTQNNFIILVSFVFLFAGVNKTSLVQLILELYAFFEDFINQGLSFQRFLDTRTTGNDSSSGSSNFVPNRIQAMKGRINE